MTFVTTYKDPFMRYPMYQVEGYPVRGPSPDPDKPYFSCLGAAQTFGRFVSHPYPEMLGNYLSMGAFNFGFAGVGPAFQGFKDLIDVINGGKFCVVQAMSGRSTGNSKFKCDGRNWGTILDTGDAGVSQKFWEYALINYSSTLLTQLVQETRANWVRDTIALINSISVPVIFLVFRRGYNRKRINVRNFKTIFQRFPQIICDDQLETIRPMVHEYVDVVTNRGMPQQLPAPIDNEYHVRQLGREPKREFYNNYYPSPEMHMDALNWLLPAVTKYVN